MQHVVSMYQEMCCVNSEAKTPSLAQVMVTCKHMRKQGETVVVHTATMSS